LRFHHGNAGENGYQQKQSTFGSHGTEARDAAGVSSTLIAAALHCFVGVATQLSVLSW
jgi:hypothetical protein